MTFLQHLLLGLIQGLTEFLPISSTAHLRVVPHFLGWPDPGAAFSAVVQLGTLAAVFAYFASDIRRLFTAALVGLKHRNLNHTPDSRLAWSILPGTLPIATLGLTFQNFIETEARGLGIIAASLIVLALLLILAELAGTRTRSIQDLGFWHIQLIGLCQALALIPGCSRSGSTIMGGLLIGLRRADAARFSFFLGLPAIGASGLMQFINLLEYGLGGQSLFYLGAGITAAAVSGYLAIGFLLHFLTRHGTYLFSFYRIALGALILSSLR